MKNQHLDPMSFKDVVINPVASVTRMFLDFFDTTPEIMSDKTAKKLNDKEEAMKLMQEIQEKRRNQELLQAK
jgi:hypothetical protein